MINMECNGFHDRLSDYLDGALAKSEASQFGAHALRCRACRQLLDGVKAALTDCKAEADLDAPFMLEESLLAIPDDHGPLDCDRFQELITEFLDGFVPAPVYSRFESHAAACHACSALLTEVVFAVAACHSVHVYEEVDLPEHAMSALLDIARESGQSVRRRLSNSASALAARLLARRSQGARWSFATAASLVLATFAYLLFGFSDDGTVAGIYRRAQRGAVNIVSQGADIYARKDDVVASIEEVGRDIGEIWDSLGGEGRAGARKAAPNTNAGPAHTKNN